MSGNESMAAAPGDRQQEFLMTWLREEQPGQLEQLWRMADMTRAQFAGDTVPVWGAVKISNYCDDDCVFCGLHAGNKVLKRYRLDAREILSCAQRAVALGCQTLILQSGCDPQVADGLSALISRIRDETGLAVSLSLGERSEAELAAWHQAGASSYLLRFMTANTILYRLLHGGPVKDPRHRLPLLGVLKNIGYRVGSGILVGFPGQSLESLADDLELMRKLDLDIVLVGPYIWPAEFGAWRSTPQPQDDNSSVAVLKAIALARQLCPGADIPAGAALATVGSMDAYGLALQRGANAVVLDLTPPEVREEYRCYPGRVFLEPSIVDGKAERLRELMARWRGGAATAASTVPGRAAANDERLHVCICMGSSCFSRGNSRIVPAVKDLLASNGLRGRAVLEGHLCEGLCNHGPNVTIDGKLHQRANPVEVLEAIRRHPKMKG